MRGNLKFIHSILYYLIITSNELSNPTEDPASFEEEIVVSKICSSFLKPLNNASMNLEKSQINKVLGSHH